MTKIDQPSVQQFEIPVTVRQPRELAQNFKLNGALVPAENAEQVADVVAFGGLGFNGNVPALAAKRTAGHEGGRGILVVEAPNYAKTGKTPKDLVRELNTDPNASWKDLFSDRLETFGAQQVNGAYDWLIDTGKITPDAHTIGESQAAKAVAEAALEDAEKMRGMLILLRAMGGVVLGSIPTLVGGLARSAPEVMFDRATVPTGLHASGQFLADRFKYGGRMSDYVIKSTIWPDVLNLAEMQPDRAVHTVVSTRDKLEPAQGQHAAAAAAQGAGNDTLTNNFYVVEGGHVSLATKPGAKQLAQVAQHARGTAPLPRYNP